MYSCKSRFTDEVRNFLSPVILIQLLTSGIEICLSGYSVMSSGGSPAELVKFAVFLSAALLQLVIWCWPGELLIQDSSAIGDTVFHDVPWYLLPPGQQRELMFIVIRAQKQCCITALGFQIMSLQKLTEVFRTTYFAVKDEFF